MEYDKKKLAIAFFGDFTHKPVKTKLLCKGGCGKHISKPFSGVTNLIQHIEGQHGDTMAATYAAFIKVFAADCLLFVFTCDVE
jgi:hypothetical protein